MLSAQLVAARQRNIPSMTNHHRHTTVICYICGMVVYTSADRSMCPECSTERKRERQRRQYVQVKRTRVEMPSSVKILYDPDPIGGFHPGAGITRQELEFGLKDRTFTPGTILLVGKLKQIVKMREGREELAPCKL